MEISIRHEGELIIFLGKHLTAGRGVDRSSSVQIRSLCRGRLHSDKYQQHQWIEGSHETLRFNVNRLPEPVRSDVEIVAKSVSSTRTGVAPPTWPFVSLLSSIRVSGPFVDLSQPSIPEGWATQTFRRSK